MIVKALQKIRPGAEWVLNGNDYGDLNWLDTVQSKPTREQVSQAVAIVQAEYTAQEYARKRVPEYPPLTDLADALYHQSKGDETKLTAYLAKCEAVKQKYPKE